MRAARSRAAASSSAALTLLMPTLEPRFAGLTKQGKPTASATAPWTSAGRDRQS